MADNQPSSPRTFPEPVLDALRHDFFIRFTTTGRRSGAPRTAETTFVWDGHRTLVISGYPGKRDWIANIAANPNVMVHTLERGVFYDLPAIARVILNREERTPSLLAFLTHWAQRPEAPRRIFNLIVSAIRLNRKLRMPWWGPFYLIRRMFDRMPCVEITLQGSAVRRTSYPPEQSHSR
jgi:deazaflavin-dependent oxidoreductase (nitroreductase family)